MAISAAIVLLAICACIPVAIAQTVSSFNPTTAASGSTITIIGSAFGTAGAAPPQSIDFGSTTITAVTYLSDTEASFVLPDGVGTGHSVTITTDGGTSGSITFDYPVPAVTAAESDFTTGGATITVTGSGFGPSAAISSDLDVTIGTTSCTTTTYSSETEALCVVPAGTYATGIDVTVTVGAQQSPNAAVFDYWRVATQLAFTPDPGTDGTVLSGDVLTTQPQVTIQDAGGATVSTGPHSTISVALTVASGTGTIGGGTTTAPGVTGVTTAFAGVFIQAAGFSPGAFTLQADATAAVAITGTSGSFTVHARATQLLWSPQPGGTVFDGDSLTTPPIVHVCDQGGNPVATGPHATLDVTLTLATNPGTGVLDGTTVDTNVVAGVADAFTDVHVDFPGLIGGAYAFQATTVAPSLTSATSSTFTVYARADSLAFSTISGTIRSGETIPAFTVDILDEDTNTLAIGTHSTLDVTIAFNGASATSGTSGTWTQTAVAGVATFNDISLDTPGTFPGSYIFDASVTGPITATSNTFTVHQTATQLDFSVIASTFRSGETLTSFTVTIQDSTGTTVSSGGHEVLDVTISRNTGSAVCVLSGTLTQTAVGGVATFNDISFDTAGTFPGSYILDAATSTPTTAGVSNTFTIHQTATQLAFAPQPTTDGSVMSGDALTGQPQIDIQDSLGNTVTSGSHSTLSVDLTIASGSGTLSGTTTASGVNGITTAFAGVTIDPGSFSPGAFTLKADTTTPTLSVTSSSFTVHARATQVVFEPEPLGGTLSDEVLATQPVAKVKDQSNNVVVSGPHSTLSVTLTLTNGAGTLQGDVTEPFVNGVVSTWTDIGIGFPGFVPASDFRITATTTGPALVKESTDISVGSAASDLEFGTITGGEVTWDPMASFTVTIVDAGTATVAGGPHATLDVTLAIGSGSGVIGGTVTVTAASGIATFNAVEIRTPGTFPGTFTLTATTVSPSLSKTSASFTIYQSATHVVFVQDPDNGGSDMSGDVLSTMPTIRLEDVDNVLVDQGPHSTLTVTLGMSAGTAELTGTTLSGAASAGVFTSFAGVTLNYAGGVTPLSFVPSTTFRLKCDVVAPAITGVSGTFTVFARGTQLTFETQPVGGTLSDEEIGTQPIVHIKDLDGNDVLTGPHHDTAITLSLSNGAGTIQGTLTRSCNAGIANTFDDIGIGFPGFVAGNDFRITATSTVPSLTVESIDVDVGSTASSLEWDVVAGGGVSGEVVDPSFTVTLKDLENNVVAGGPHAILPITLSISTGVGTEAGTWTVNAVAGVATFTNVIIDEPGNFPFAFELDADTMATTALTATSAPFTIYRAATNIVFTTQPANSGLEVSGDLLADQPVIEIRDVDDNLISTGPHSTLFVQLTLSAGFTADLKGTPTGTNAGGGTISFSGITLDYINTPPFVDDSFVPATDFTLDATIVAPSIVTVTAPFVVYARGVRLVYIDQPVGECLMGDLWTTQPVLEILGFDDNRVLLGPDSYTDVQVFLDTSGTGKGTMFGTSLQTNVTAGLIDGLGFLEVDDPAFLPGNDFRLNAVATSANVPDLMSDPFTIWAIATSLFITVQPDHDLLSGDFFVAAPEFEIHDQDNNVVAVGIHSQLLVTLSVYSGVGVVESDPSSVYQRNGVAGIVNGFNPILGYNGTIANSFVPGTFELEATTSDPVLSVVTGTFPVHARMTAMTFETQPATTDVLSGDLLTVMPRISIDDYDGNRILTGWHSELDVAIVIHTGTGDLQGTLVDTNVVAGYADAFAGMVIDYDIGLDKDSFLPGAFRFEASTSMPPMAVVSDPFVVHGRGVSLQVVTEPVGFVLRGTPLSTAPVFRIADFRNDTILTGPHSVTNVSLELVSGVGEMRNTTSCLMTNGTSPCFDDLYIDGGPTTFFPSSLFRFEASTAFPPLSVQTIDFEIWAVLDFIDIFVQPIGDVIATDELTVEPAVFLRDFSNNTITFGMHSSIEVNVRVASGDGVVDAPYNCTAVAGYCDDYGGIALNETTDFVPGNFTFELYTIDPYISVITNPVPVFAKAASVEFDPQPVGDVLAGEELDTMPGVRFLDIRGLLVDRGPDSELFAFLSLAGGVGTVTGDVDADAVGGLVTTFTGLRIGPPAFIPDDDFELAVESTSPYSFKTLYRESVQFEIYAKADSLYVEIEPGGFVMSGQTLSSMPEFRILDPSSSLVISGPHSTLTANLSLSSGSGTLKSTVVDESLTLNAASGVFSDFQGLLIDYPNFVPGDNFRLVAQLLEFPSITVTTIPFHIYAYATRLLFAQQPVGNVLAGFTMSTMPIVHVADEDSNIIDDGPHASIPVSVELTGSGTLSGTVDDAGAVAGVADDFAGLSVNYPNFVPTIGSFMLRAFTYEVVQEEGAIQVIPVPALSQLSNPFTIHAFATNLYFHQEPVGEVLSDDDLSVQPIVYLRDQDFNIVAHGPDSILPVTISLPPAMGLLGQTLTLNGVAGAIVYTGIDVSFPNFAPSAAFVLTATSGGMTVDSAPFQLYARAESVVVNANPIGDVLSGDALSVQPSFDILDLDNNVIAIGPHSELNVTLSVTGGQGSLDGQLVAQAVGGTATFENSTIDYPNFVPSTDFQLNGTITALDAAGAVRNLTVQTSTFEMFARAFALVVTTQPIGNVVSGDPLSQMPEVETRDQSNQKILVGPHAALTVQASLVGISAVLFGTDTSTSSAGLADQWVDLALDNGDFPNDFRLRFFFAPPGPPAIAVASNPFRVWQTATSLEFSTQPVGDMVAGLDLGTAPIVRILDIDGDLITEGDHSTLQVFLNLTSGSGTLKPAVNMALAASGGVAGPYVGLTINYPNFYPSPNFTMNATTVARGQPITAKSDTFSVHAGASSIYFGIEPVGDVVSGDEIAILPNVYTIDPNGDIVTVGDISDLRITLTLNTGNGTLYGTNVADSVAGVASVFPGLSVDFPDFFPGDFTLHAESSLGPIMTDISAIFVVHARATLLEIAQQPIGDVVSGIDLNLPPAQPPVFDILDASNNTVLTGPHSVLNGTLNVTNGEATLFGQYSTTCVGGVCSAFPGLTLSLPGIFPFDFFRLNFTTTTGPRLTVQTDDFTIFGGADYLIFSQTLIGDRRAGEPLQVDPVVSIMDKANEVVDVGFHSTLLMNVTLYSGSGTLNGLPERNAVAGVVDFSGLTIGYPNFVPGNFTLVFQTLVEPFISLYTAPFLVHANAHHIEYAVQPFANVVSGTVFPTLPVVRILDEDNNVVRTGEHSTLLVTLSLQAGGVADIKGTSSVFAVEGIAQGFTGLALDYTTPAMTASFVPNANFRLVASILFNSLDVVSNDVEVYGRMTNLFFSVEPRHDRLPNQPLQTMPVVRIRDNSNAIITFGPHSTLPVSLALVGGEGTEVMSGTNLVTAVNGVASFAIPNDLALSTTAAGEKFVDTLRIRASATGDAVVTRDSVALTVYAVAKGLIFVTQPVGNVVRFENFETMPVVEIVDGLNNRVTAGPHSTLDVTITLEGTTFPFEQLYGTTSDTGVLLGLADAFSGLQLSSNGTFYLDAEATALIPLEVSSAPFNIRIRENSVPVWTSPVNISVTEDDPVNVYGVNVTDIDVDDNYGTGEFFIRMNTTGKGKVQVAALFGITFIDGDGTGGYVLSFTGPWDTCQAALGTLKYLPDPDRNLDGRIDLFVSDLGNVGLGGAKTATAQIDVYIQPDNDAPQFVLTQPLSFPNVREEEVMVWNGIQVSDIDVREGADILRVRMETLGNAYVALNNVSTLNYIEGTGKPGVVQDFIGLSADVNAALANITFFGLTNYHGPEALQITVYDQGNFGDGGTLSETITVSVTIVSVNDQPVIHVPNGNLIVDENLILTVPLNISDADVDEGSGLLRITVGTDGEGTVSLPTTAGLVFTTGTGFEDTSFDIIGTVGDLNSALNGMTFRGDFGYSGPEHIAVFLEDRGESGILGGSKNDSYLINVTVVAIPTVTGATDSAHWGSQILIEGDDFGSVASPATAWIGGQQCVSTTWTSPTTMFCTPQPGFGGPHTVEVYVNNRTGNSAPALVNFIYFDWDIKFSNTVSFLGDKRVEISDWLTINTTEPQIDYIRIKIDNELLQESFIELPDLHPKGDNVTIGKPWDAADLTYEVAKTQSDRVTFTLEIKFHGYLTTSSAPRNIPKRYERRLEINVKEPNPPNVINFLPKDGPSCGNDLITIAGTSLGVTEFNLTGVWVGDMPCATYTWLAQEVVTCVTPENVRDGNLTVETTSGVDRFKVPYTINEKAQIDLIDPPSALLRVPRVIKIQGQRLGRKPSDVRSVTIAGKPCSDVEWYNETTLYCTSPVVDLPYSGGVVVDTVSACDSPAQLNFNFESARVGTLVPPFGPIMGYTTVTLLGANFGSVPESLVSISLGSAPCNSTEWVSENEVICISAPVRAANTSTGYVDVVTTESGSALEGFTVGLKSQPPPVFRYRELPVVTGMSPRSGPREGNQLVTIQGYNFGDSEEELVAISLMSVPCRSVAWISSVEIQCVSGASDIANRGPIAVSIAGVGTGVSSGIQVYEYEADEDPPPGVFEVSPAVGSRLGGDLVTLTGRNFGKTRFALKSVSLAGIECDVAWDGWRSSTQVVCTSRLSPIDLTGEARVETGAAGGYSLATFSYETLPPVLDDVHPRVGSNDGGTFVTIFGSGFGDRSPVDELAWRQARYDDAVAVAEAEGLGQVPRSLFGLDVTPDELLSVTIGSVECVAVEWLDPERIVCETPPAAALNFEEPHFVVTVDGRFNDPPADLEYSYVRNAALCDVCGFNGDCANAYCLCRPGWHNSPHCDEPVARTEIKRAYLREDKSDKGRLDIVLSATPTAPVTIEVASADTGECRPDDDSVVFGAGQTGSKSVDVSVVYDLERDGDAPCQVNLIARSEDPAFTNVTLASQTFTVGESWPVLDAISPPVADFNGTWMTIVGINFDLALDVLVDGAEQSAEFELQWMSEILSGRVDEPETMLDAHDGSLRTSSRRTSSQRTARLLPLSASDLAGMDRAERRRTVLQLLQDEEGEAAGSGSGGAADDVGSGSGSTSGNGTVSDGYGGGSATNETTTSDVVELDIDYIVQIKFRAPPHSKTGYLPLTIRNFGETSVTDKRLIYYADACTEPGQFGTDDAKCKSCPAGASCPGGNRVWPAAGYWNEGEDSGFVARCKSAERCIGGRDSVCGETYTGELCGACVTEYYEDRGRCDSCPPFSSQLVDWIGALLFWGLVAFLVTMVENRNTVSYFISTIVGLQMLSGVAELATSDLPAWLKFALRGLRIVTADYLFVKPECLLPEVPYWQMFVGGLVFNLICFAPTWGGLALVRTISIWHYKKKKAPPLQIQERAEFFRDRFVRTLHIAATCIYLSVTTRSLEVLWCVPIGSRLVMWARTDVQCFAGLHLYVAGAAGFLLLTLTVLYPIVYALRVIRGHRDDIRDDPRYLESQGFHFELLVSHRRAFYLVDFVIFLALATARTILSDRLFYRTIGLFVLFLAKLVIAFVVRPYETRLLNNMQAVLSLTAMLALFTDVGESELKVVPGDEQILLLLNALMMAFFGIFAAVMFGYVFYLLAIKEHGWRKMGMTKDESGEYVERDWGNVADIDDVGTVLWLQEQHKEEPLPAVIGASDVLRWGLLRSLDKLEAARGSIYVLDENGVPMEDQDGEYILTEEEWARREAERALDPNPDMLDKAYLAFDEDERRRMIQRKMRARKRKKVKVMKRQDEWDSDDEIPAEQDWARVAENIADGLDPFHHEKHKQAKREKKKLENSGPLATLLRMTNLNGLFGIEDESDSAEKRESKAALKAKLEQEKAEKRARKAAKEAKRKAEAEGAFFATPDQPLDLGIDFGDDGEYYYEDYEYYDEEDENDQVASGGDAGSGDANGGASASADDAEASHRASGSPDEGRDGDENDDGAAAPVSSEPPPLEIVSEDELAAADGDAADEDEEDWVEDGDWIDEGDGGDDEDDANGYWGEDGLWYAYEDE